MFAATIAKKTTGKRPISDRSGGVDRIGPYDVQSCTLSKYSRPKNTTRQSEQRSSGVDRDCPLFSWLSLVVNSWLLPEMIAQILSCSAGDAQLRRRDK